MGEYTPVHLIEQRKRKRPACFMVVFAAVSVVEPRARPVEPHPFHRLLEI